VQVSPDPQKTSIISLVLRQVSERSGCPWRGLGECCSARAAINQWVARGVDGRFVVKRLRNSDEVLTSVALERLRSEASRFAGRQYDLSFEWSDDRIYCSELVWKVYDRSLGIQIGKLQKVRDFNLSDPSVKAKMRERYGTDIPLSEPVISPVAMFKSPLLVTVRAK